MSKYNCPMGDPLDMLAEECAEVIQAAMKARRFGLSGAPGWSGIKPRDEIVKEIGDVLACIELLQSGKGFLFIHADEIEDAKQKKLTKVKEYFLED